MEEETLKRVRRSVARGMALGTARWQARIASRFAGAEISAQSPDLADALGELANIVAGQAKSRMDGLNIAISLPRVVAGAGHCVLKSNNMPVLALPCDSSLGRFSVEVAMMVNKTPAPALPS